MKYITLQLRNPYINFVHVHWKKALKCQLYPYAPAPQKTTTTTKHNNNKNQKRTNQKQYNRKHTIISKMNLGEAD